MDFKWTLPFIIVLFFHTQSIGQYAADGTQGTFYSIINDSKKYIEQIDVIISENEPSIVQIRYFKAQLQEIRKSIETWTHLIEKLTDPRNLALGSAIGTISLLFIIQSIIYIHHYSRKLCSN
jgi:hypothetical protein